jgi:CheY-like chemotaxis protein
MPTILVVDDAVDTCRNLADLFEDLGYRVETAEDGQFALEKTRQQRYDLGLLDLRMPGMDGLTLCRHLQRMQPRMVRLIVTAYGDPDLSAEARAAGARYVVPKPIDCPRLLALVEEGVGRPEDEAN